MLALVLVHGIFWSGLLSASAAYMTNLLPERRRAEGIGYWGLSTVAALAVAPTIGFWIYRRGWLWLCVVSAALNLTMAIIAWFLPEHPVDAAPSGPGGLLEWRVLVDLGHAVSLLVRYGGITSFTALYAEANQRHAKGHLPDDARGRDPADPPAGGTARGSIRIQAGVRAVPRV